MSCTRRKEQISSLLFEERPASGSGYGDLHVISAPRPSRGVIAGSGFRQSHSGLVPVDPFHGTSSLGRLSCRIQGHRDE